MGAGEDSQVTAHPAGGQDRRQVPGGAGPYPYLPQVQLAEAGPAGRHRAVCTPGCHGRQWLLRPLRENVSVWPRPASFPSSPKVLEVRGQDQALKWTDKQNVACPHDMPSCEKEQSPDTGFSTGEL